MSTTSAPRKLISVYRWLTWIVALHALMPAVAMAKPADFDNDGLSDLVVYRPYDHNLGGIWYSRWYVYASSGVQCPYGAMTATGNGCYFDWGLPGDIPLSGDFDADGKTDFTVYRPSNLTWYIYSAAGSYVVASNDTTMQAGDLPDETDFNNDNRSDILFYRPSTKKFYVRIYNGSTIVVSNYNRTNLGTGEVDPPLMVSANYDSTLLGGDAAVSVPISFSSCGSSQIGWFWVAGGSFTSSGTCVGSTPFTDRIVSGNYGGSAVNLGDFTHWTPSTGTWHITYNGGGANSNIGFGLNGDIPVGFIKTTAVGWSCYGKTRERSSPPRARPRRQSTGCNRGRTRARPCRLRLANKRSLRRQ